METAKKTRKTKKTSIQKNKTNKKNTINKKDKANASDAIIVEEKAEEKSIVKDLLKKSTKLSKTDDSSNKRAETIANLAGVSVEDILNKEEAQIKAEPQKAEQPQQPQQPQIEQASPVFANSKAEDLLF